jgi:hypothetical protein
MSLSQDQLAILKIFIEAKPKLRKSLLENGNKVLIQALCECVLNILLGNVNIDDEQKDKLRKHKNLLRNISKKGDSWKEKKKILQKGGSLILPLLFPIISSIISAFI